MFKKILASPESLHRETVALTQRVMHDLAVAPVKARPEAPELLILSLGAREKTISTLTAYTATHGNVIASLVNRILPNIFGGMQFRPRQDDPGAGIWQPKEFLIVPTLGVQAILALDVFCRAPESELREVFDVGEGYVSFLSRSALKEFCTEEKSFLSETFSVCNLQPKTYSGVFYPGKTEGVGGKSGFLLSARPT